MTVGLSEIKIHNSQAPSVLVLKVGKCTLEIKRCHNSRLSL
jgi:hypothetical protein